jgi:diguanylate cyclase (GGDEF)-like protein
LCRAEILARADLEIKKALRSKNPVSFLMLDIDHFKRVNDTYGHPTGDQVLIFLVKKCMEELREIDIFGRVGGEEFFVVLPETDKEEALEIAERLRGAIERSSCRTANGNEISITISVGVAVYYPVVEQVIDSSAIIKKYYAACDEAMYQAKEAGRNQIYC